MKFDNPLTLVTYFPKPHHHGPGQLEISRDGTARFFQGDKIAARLIQAKLTQAIGIGIFLIGMEACDDAEDMTESVYKYQQWFLKYRMYEEKSGDHHE